MTKGKRSIFFKYLLIPIFLLGFSQGFSQTAKPSREQIIKYYSEARAKGMSDEEIEKLAIAQGYTVEEISRVRRELVTPPLVRTEEVTGVVGSREPPDTLAGNVSKKILPSNSQEEIKVFGADFFSTTSSSFEPNLRIATPLDYVLGPDDEITIDLSGKYNEVFKLRVSPEGTVRILNFPPIYVSGLSVDQAKKRIAAKLGTAYSGSGVYSNIALTKIRSIRVTVAGLAGKPGTYTLSSLATVFHALHLSGGPSFNGSFRKIEVLRNNNVIRKIDLYKYIVDADASDNIMLQDQDVILIRPYDTRLLLEGEIKEPAYFEAIPGESLKRIIDYAGGYTPDAYTHSIRYRRNTGKEYKVGQVTEAELPSFLLKNGDRFQIGRTLDRFENRVTIEGAVFRAGDYAIEPGLLTVKQLITQADGLIESAFLTRGLIKRQGSNLDRVNIAFDLSKLMSGEAEDIALARNDTVVIKSASELREVEKITIVGEVIKGGIYEFGKGMTVPDLIFLAGGFTNGGVPHRIEVSRRVKRDTADIPANQNIRVFELEVSANLALSEGPKFVLEPFDYVIVRRSPRYESQKHVYITGEVKYPGLYAIKDNFEKISDLIDRSGGLKPESYIEGANFKRDGNMVALDLSWIMKDRSIPSNLMLRDKDTLEIPRKLETVEITGQVLNPSMINYDSKFRFRDYVSQAGGFTELSKRSSVYVTYPNGRTERSKRSLLFFRNNPRIEPGSVIVVPSRDNDIKREPLTRSERIMMFTVISTTAATLLRVIQEIVTK